MEVMTFTCKNCHQEFKTTPRICDVFIARDRDMANLHEIWQAETRLRVLCPYCGEISHYFFVRDIDQETIIKLALSGREY